MARHGSAQTAHRRQGYSISTWGTAKTLLFYGAVFVLFSSVIENFSLIEAHQLMPVLDSRSQNESGICRGLDIRNKLERFKKLEGCRVIEGPLRILLFDNLNETELAKISFPELTEITDYLLLFRVNGLRSVGHLFPNLALIRGQKLFLGVHAFMIFEMTTLQEIGLYSLTDIFRGSVHIDKNPSLCFVHSIDWSRIVHDKSAKLLIKSLKPENECPICPGEEDAISSGNCSLACPKAPIVDVENYEKDRHLCWNRQHCQKICPENCTSCNNKLECCNPRCIGGCSDDDINSCTVCRNFSMNIENTICMDSCPKGYYKFLDRRCLTREQCINRRPPIDLDVITVDDEMSYKTFNDSCVLLCPANYAEDNENHTCKPCGGRCRKECSPLNIDSITLAKQLRGCTIITGSLEIQLRGGSNVVTELEENLSMIEEIYGYLKVVRSFSLVSLNFFKSLKRIRGHNLEKNKYAFIVLDNQNLQDLWDWNNRTLQIDNGRIFFHFNPKLCYNKIEELQAKIGLQPPFTDMEVAYSSNGDKVACNITELKVNISDIKNKSIILKWLPFQIDDSRKLLGYIVYSTEAVYRNITLYDGRDACGQDNWHVDDVPNTDEKDKNASVTHILTNLKPYTLYAFYVKTYTLATEKSGAQSPIHYARTRPSMPSSPVGVTVSTNSSDSVLVRWLPPVNPNGNITHYIVSGKKHVNSMLDSKDRNYCKDPPTIPKQQDNHQVVATTPPPKNNDTCCTCEDSKQIRMSIDESEEAARIKFEDELHNQVYHKKTKEVETRRKRGTMNYRTINSTMLNQGRKGFVHTFPNYTDLIHHFDNTEIQNVTENGTDIRESFSFPVYGKTELYIDKLHHFTFYDIYVQVCRQKEGNGDLESACSSTSIRTARTKKKLGADDIGKVQITNQSLETVTITWDQPIDPNGIIFSVSVEYSRVDIENANPNFECITLKDFKNRTMSYTITKLFPGNYSLRVRATSSAGLGEYSPYIYFHIKEPTSNTVVIVLVILFILVLVLVLLFVVLYRKHIKERDMRLIPSVNPEYVPSVYVPDDWEVPRNKIELIKELGQGSFGMVWEGLAHNLKGKALIRCAVKTVNEHATNRERLEFLNEASVMKAFDTAHVVRLLGVVSQGQPTLVIMELMAFGDLKSYLRSHRPDIEHFHSVLAKPPPTLKQILQMAIEIADGMAYLSAKKFVHRDLAARNCMVSEELTVKIGDFGMTRDIYETDYYRKGTKGLLPVRWMAPESLKDGVFTTSSDVWSYGVVLWEMATLASQPYQGLSNDQVLRYVIDGGVMERPENCPDKLYTLMRYCWQPKPSSRPTFLKLCQLLLDDAGPNFGQVSFYHSPAGTEARAIRMAPSPSQDEPSTPLRRLSDRIEGYTPSMSQDSDDIDIDTHHHFPSISESAEVTRANGYVSCCPKNGATAQSTQC